VCGGQGFSVSQQDFRRCLSGGVVDGSLEETGRKIMLSKREREVIKLVAEGKRNGQIAVELCIAISTVSLHLNKIYNILAEYLNGGHKRVKLARMYWEQENSK